MKNNQSELTLSTESAQKSLTLSSLQIAEITGKDHAHVMRDIRSTLEEAGIGLSRFGSSYRNAQNKEQPCYLLPRRECDLVMSGYSVKYRLLIIDRWQELEKQVATPAALPNYAEALRLLADQIEANTALNLSVASLTPKAAALDRIADSDGLLCITNAAKVLQMPPKKLFAWMQEHGWIYRRAGNAEWIPYQEQIRNGRMTMKAHSVYSKSAGEDRVHEQALLTPKGLAYIASVLGIQLEDQ